jgi:hypothetical protein
MNTAWDVEGWVWGFGEDRTIAHELSNLVLLASASLPSARWPETLLDLDEPTLGIENNCPHTATRSAGPRCRPGRQQEEGRESILS